MPGPDTYNAWTMKKHTSPSQTAPAAAARECVGRSVGIPVAGAIKTAATRVAVQAAGDIPPP